MSKIEVRMYSCSPSARSGHIGPILGTLWRRIFRLSQSQRPIPNYQPQVPNLWAFTFVLSYRNDEAAVGIRLCVTGLTV